MLSNHRTLTPNGEGLYETHQPTAVRRIYPFGDPLARAYNAAMEQVSPEADAALRELVDEYRERCLWFLRRDYYPATSAEAHRVLEAIQRHGDRDGFRRAAQIRQWLSRSSSAASVGS